ncbi:MAG: hypothetical protein HND58_06565 [Planctomycetota bacterium]|nr:MAG: hypothetical protein HND58_06565 [Planctomycetota bacterium]
MSRTLFVILATAGLAPSMATAARVDRPASGHAAEDAIAGSQLRAGQSGDRSRSDALPFLVFSAAGSLRTPDAEVTTPGAFVFDHTRHSTVREAYAADTRTGGHGSRPDNRWLQSGTILSGPNAEPPSFRTPGNISRLASGGVVVKDGGDPEVVVPLPSAALMSLAGLGVVACRRRR